MSAAPESFSHLSADGGARMVDVGAKPDQSRRAVAEGRLTCSPKTIELLRAKALPKGDVLTVAKIAGIQAAKSTAQLIPLCHPLALSHVDVEFAVEADGIVIRATARLTGKTGVEMEALTAGHFTEPLEWIRVLLPDDQAQLEAALIRLADVEQCPLIITTGGTGPSARDVTPEATLAVIRKELPGFGEVMRMHSYEKVKTA